MGGDNLVHPDKISLTSRPGRGWGGQQKQWGCWAGHVGWNLGTGGCVGCHHVLDVVKLV